MSLNLDRSDDLSEPQPLALPNHPAAAAAPTARRLGRPCRGNPTLRGVLAGRAEAAARTLSAQFP